MSRYYTKIILLLILTALFLFDGPPMAIGMPAYDDVLVVVNQNSQLSKDIAQYFMDRRVIPVKNKCLIDVPASGTTASAAEASAAIASITSCLQSNQLTSKINYIVLSADMPMYNRASATGSSLQSFDYRIIEGLSNPSVYVFCNNPYYYYQKANYNTPAARNFTSKKYKYYIVSRLDGSGSSNIKSLIDNSGSPSYNSYKKGINFIYNTPIGTGSYGTAGDYLNNASVINDPNGPSFEKSWSQQWGVEYRKRGNINTLWYPLANSIKVNVDNISFMNWDMVNGPNQTDTNLEISHEFPFIYRKLSFSPGSIGMIYRSFPNASYSRNNGGLYMVDRTGTNSFDFKQSDGSDLTYRHMTHVAYDPDDEWIWASTGINQQDVSKQPGSVISEVQESESERGNGIVVFSLKDKAKVLHLNTSNGLASNRVTKTVYDSSHHRMWILSYKGVQYYDLHYHQLSPALEGLSDPAASSFDLYVDAFNPSLIFVTFYYSGNKIGSQIPGANRNVFLYDKNLNKITKLDMGVALTAPKIAKSDARSLWVLSGFSLIKYDLIDNKVILNFDLKSTVPEGERKYLAAPRFFFPHTNSLGEKNLYVSMTTSSQDAAYPSRSMLLRLSDLGDSLSPQEIHNTYWQAASNRQGIVMVSDLQNIDRLYMLSADSKIYTTQDSQGKDWSIIEEKDIPFAKSLATNGLGQLFVARGYESSSGQQIMTDFQANGLCGSGGGMTHDTLSHTRYCPSSSAQLINDYKNLPYTASSQIDTLTHINAMALMMLDGYMLAEARFGVFLAYPSDGGGGHIGHMMVFDPKMSPYAPRVDEESTSLNINNPNDLSVKLINPGLPSEANHPDISEYGFLASTINTKTVLLKDEAGSNLAVNAIQYVEVPQTGKMSFEIHVTPKDPFVLNKKYRLWLRCGPDGIKNKKGAALMNTRENEHLDSITLLYTYQNLGDVSGDGKVTSYDAALVSRYMLGKSLTATQTIRADDNEDKRIDETDIKRISKRALGIK